MQQNATSVDLLTRFRSGDREALGDLLERHTNWLWSYVRRRMSRELRLHEASLDIVQDVFRTLIEKGPRFVPQNDDQFRRLVATIVVNRLHDRHDWIRAARRDHRREVGSPVEEITHIGLRARSEDAASRVAQRKEESGLLELALELIDPDDAAIVRWRTWEDLPFAELGQRIKLTPDAARMRFHRAVAKLGEMMQRLDEGKLADLARDLDP